MAVSRIPARLRPALVAVGLCAAAWSTARAEDAPGLAWPLPGGRLEIAKPYGGSEIRIGVSSRTAGAIDSLTWGGLQFVNSFDHGRELQSAASFDGYGECLNPTEAGSNADGIGPASTSLLTALGAGPDWLQTTTRMAWWLRPGEGAGTCPKGLAGYTSARSDITLTKRVTIGAAGVANAVAYRATFTLPQAHTMGAFEAATGYMPATFSQFFTYDPATGTRAPIDDGPAEQTLPVIFATPDGGHAMGVYAPGLPQAQFPGSGYGRFRFANLPGVGNATVKWNCVFREQPLAAGDHSYTCYVVVGTLAEVEQGIGALRAALGQGSPPAPRPTTEAVHPAPATARPPAPATALYVGMQGGCNAGVVTTEPAYKGCATAPIGATVGAEGVHGPAVYAGITAGLNAGVVSSNPRHLGGDSRPIGFLRPAGSGGTPVFIGLQPNCNAGVASTNPAHLNCRSAPIGETLR
ncbi:hypothetical protein [Methylobacterium sp. A54F]